MSLNNLTAKDLKYVNALKSSGVWTHQGAKNTFVYNIYCTEFYYRVCFLIMIVLFGAIKLINNP